MADDGDDEFMKRMMMRMVVVVVADHLWLLVVLHGEGEGVEHDGGEHGVLAHRRGGERPQLQQCRFI